MLIVLSLLVVVVTAIGGLARAAAMRHRETKADTSAIAAIFLLDAIESPEGPVVHWLEEDSQQAVLSPDVTEPRVPVLDDIWFVDGETYRVTVTAWDQCGMVPLQLARKGSPLRLVLPEHVRRLIDDAEVEQTTKPGLDQFVGVARETGRETVVFPSAVHGREGAQQFSLSGESVIAGHADDTSTALRLPALIPFGGLVATHNVDPPRININTAPLPLVEAALREAGFGGIDSIRHARREERSAILSTGAAAGRRRGDDRSLRIVNTSDLWSFRIDITVGKVTTAWWCVYERVRSRHRRSAQSGWRCVQRLRITE